MRVARVAWQVGQDSLGRTASEIARPMRSFAGRALDPSLDALFVEVPDHFLAGLEGHDLTKGLLAAEPDDHLKVSGDGIDRALSAIADFGDVIGHSRRVSSVARKAAKSASMSARDVDLVVRAALVHDIGRVGVQSSWTFYIGGYQPAQKWLQDRKGRALTLEDVKHYRNILKILAETDRIMQTITMTLETGEAG